MGVWVNSDYAVSNPPDDPSDNAGLIQSAAGTDVGSIINFSSAAGISTVSGIAQQVSIYPNPATANFQIAFTDNSKQAAINVYDVSGKLVLNKKMNGSATIDASTLNEGVYTVSILTNEGLTNKRIVIVK